MKILISGYGSHAKRRILPALLECKGVSEIDVVLRNKVDDKDNNVAFRDFSLAENKKRKYDYIIISSPPYAHKENLTSLKDNSDNFIIEKPIFDNLGDFTDKNLLAMFKNKNIAEGLMYLYHPMWAEVKKIFNTEKVIEFSSSFTIPHIEKTNYRYIKNKGGGFTLDLGTYPISLFFNLVNEDFKIVKSQINYEKGYEVDLTGELEIIYGRDVLYKAKWGAGLEYSNILKIKTNKSNYTFPFIFTKSEEYDSYYIKKFESKESTFQIGNHNQFKLMYENYFSNNINQIGFNNNLMKTYSFLFEIMNTKS